MILLQNDSDDHSAEPLAMRYLSDAQKEQLGLLLEQYLTEMESGLPPTIESLVVEMPELLEPLRACVDGLENLHRMTSGEPNPKLELPHERSARRLGDFDLHEKIGRGGMGVVYRATQLSLKRTVAIKLLPLTAVLDSRQLIRFQHEAEAAASLQHPNIVPVFAVGCERGVHFYAMQFIDGESLDQMLNRRRDALEDVNTRSKSDPASTTPVSHMPWRRAVAYAIQVAEGLHAAHEFGVIHRDIKPSNLILDQNDKLWITDFGLARIQNDVSLTQSGDIVGTMRYMSPEQAHGQSAIVDGRTDVYSLGATLYEMLCLRPVHEGDDAPAILRLIDNDSITPLHRYRSDLPLDLETVVTKAMAKHRDGRYETALDFAKDLRRVLAGEPTAARPPTIIDYISRWANKHRNAVALSALVGLIGLIGVSIFTAMLAAEKQISDANAIRAMHFGYQASRNEQTAREAIDRLGTQMAESLSDIPAANAVRRRLLGETLDYYRRIASETSADGGIGKDLAITYGKIGEFESELGSNKQSIEALKKSEQLFATLVQRSPHDWAMQLQWSISQNNLAEQLGHDGQLQEAAQWFGKAIANQQSLRSHLGEEAVTELATTLNNLGLLLANAEHESEAAAAYHRAIKLLEESGHRDDLLASVESNLGGLLCKRDPSEAKKFARKALLQQAAAMDKDPSNAKLATQVMLTLNTLGTAQNETLEHTQAIESFLQATSIGEQLLTRWPDQPTYQRDYVISMNHLGLSYSSVGKLDKASDCFEASLTHGRKLAENFADDAEVQSMLGGVLNNAGFLKRQLGDVAAAKRLYHEAIQHQQRAVEVSPEVPRYRAYLEKHRHNMVELGDKT